MQMVMAPLAAALPEPLAWRRTNASAPASLATAARSLLLMSTSWLSRVIRTE